MADVGGITITHTTNAREIVARLERSRADLRGAMEDALAEQALAYNQDLRGAVGGQGITPFDTGRLLTSGNTIQAGINLTFENEAQEEGREAYASFAHHAGQPVGDYAAESGRAFGVRFGPELLAAWDAIGEAALSGEPDAPAKMRSAAKGRRRKPQTFGAP